MNLFVKYKLLFCCRILIFESLFIIQLFKSELCMHVGKASANLLWFKEVVS